MMSYTNTATGIKLSQALRAGKGDTSTRRDYAGPFVFVNNAPAWVSAPHGRFVQVNGSWENEFHLRDHLGNTRVVLMEERGGPLATLQQNHYYPFGMLNPSLSTGNTLGALKDNRYLYNGKELQDEFGLDWYDYGWRFYDAQIGRWHVVDPLVEQAPGRTPYRYGFNNPIRYTDPDGRWEWDATGNLIAQKGDNSYSLAKFLGTSQKNAMTILNRGGVTANDKGVLNLKAGQVFNKKDLWVGFKSASGPVVNNTKEAIAHYFSGKGVAADVGDQSTRELLSSSKFQTTHNKITSQEVEPKGYFSVDLTNSTFHIGRTNVDYNVSGNETSSSVTYTLFSRDDFWDPDFIDEKVLGGWLGIDKFKPDQKGPNLERLGGTPYDYKTRERTFFSN